ncbi:MAG: metal ABC transporter permease [Tannerella sp.]|jgi:zinc transport system permease protein|nr:metal ABC transporter permease [Tannerella sp.]
MLELLALSPILKGLILLTVAGISFPITGVYLLRLNLLPLRFMLMHGAILGGAVALAFSWNPFVTTITLNLLFVLFMTKASRSLRKDAGYMSSFFMVISISLAFILVYRFNVQAKDTLSLLWGSLYTSTWEEVVAVIVFSSLLILFQLFYYRKLQAFFFDREIAYTSGVNERFLYYAIVLLTALTVAMAMKIIGALLLDALLLLPALIATFHAKSLRGVLVWSSLWGGLFAVGGFFLALVFDIPASSAIAVLASIVFLVILIVRRK